MAVLNPPRSLPGLGRSIVNFLCTARGEWSEDKLLELFKPEGLNDAPSSSDGVRNTVSAFRAIGVLRSESGSLSVSESVSALGTKFSVSQFRRVMQVHVFNLDRDGNPWRTEPGEAHTSGAKDLMRPLSWMLAQDALRPLSWTDNIQTMQRDQFESTNNDEWAISNDTRATSSSRWALALGLVSPSMGKGSGIVPLPVVAIDDVIDELPTERIPISDFLAGLGAKLPVLHGGVVRKWLVEHIGGDPDPGIASDCAVSSVGQALRILDERGRLKFEALPDAPGLRLSRSEDYRQTHVTVLRKAKR